MLVLIVVAIHAKMVERSSWHGITGFGVRR